MLKLEVKLNMGATYHPQFDGQTEKVNQCLEQYLRTMVFGRQNKWAQYLPLAEWWYNTNWHSATKFLPFEALYGYSPPQLGLGSAPKSQVESVNVFLDDRQTAMLQLNKNLQKTQERMKRNEDKHRSERKSEEGDWVYLKLQPYRQISVGGMRNQKLSPKYYGPFEISKKVGVVAYRLNLSPNSLIHPVFHVSQLKAKLGNSQVPSPIFPVLGPNTNPSMLPHLVLDRRVVKRCNTAAAQLLIQWKSQSPDDATWEDYEVIAQRFSDFIREDTNFVKAGGMQRRQMDLGVTIGVIGLNKEEEMKGSKGSDIGKLVNSKYETDNGTQTKGMKSNARRASMTDTRVPLTQNKRENGDETGDCAAIMGHGDGHGGTVGESVAIRGHGEGHGEYVVVFSDKGQNLLELVRPPQLLLLTWQP